jgi:uncharacterized membrane protein YoaK (UPF0700 family)
VEPLLVALSLLTLVTGLVDAACYLGLGRVFTANMTGNVVLLAFGATRAQGLPVLAPTVSLVVFLLAAAAGGRLASRRGGPAATQVPAPARRRWLTIALLTELLLVAVAALAAAGLPAGDGGARRYVVIGLLAGALGLQNATVRRLAVPDMTTTVLTLTLTGARRRLPVWRRPEPTGGAARRHRRAHGRRGVGGRAAAAGRRGASGAGRGGRDRAGCDVAPVRPVRHRRVMSFHASPPSGDGRLQPAERVSPCRIRQLLWRVQTAAKIARSSIAELRSDPALHSRLDSERPNRPGLRLSLLPINGSRLSGDHRATGNRWVPGDR